MHLKCAFFFAVTPNHNSHNRNSFDAQADKIRAAILPEIRKDSKVDLKKIRSSFIVYRQSKGYCLNFGKSNHSTSTCRIDPVDAIVKQLHQQSQQQDNTSKTHMV
ncbi:hypothetical protein ACTFIT_001945 [Dictyostelium discoideum]